jgi:hypothetical protein
MFNANFLAYTGGRVRPAMRLTKNRTMKITNSIHAICVAAPATPDNPNNPAISPMIKKVIAQLSICVSFRYGRYRGSRATKTFLTARTLLNQQG